MRRLWFLALLVGSSVCLPAAASRAQPYTPSDHGVAAENAECGREVVFGTLVVTDASVGAFVLYGHDGEFLAPAGVDVRAFDRAVVRIDFDDRCSVRTIARADPLAEPTLEA